MRRSSSRVFLSSLATLLLSFPAAAQQPTLICQTPAEPAAAGPCTLKATANPGQHAVTVQITNARRVRGTPVEFTVEEPGRRIVDRSRTDADGKATFSWIGAAGTGVKVTARAVVAGREVTRIIDVNAPATASTQRSLVLVSDSVLFGYEKRQIQGPVTVRIENFGERCESNVLLFKPYGTVGTGSPDSVRAIQNPVLGGCTASTWWRLGEGVGRQHLRTTIADEPSKSLILNAVARALPRLSAGVVSSYDFREYRTANISERNVQITRRVTDPSGGDSLITVVVDSTVKSVSLGRENAGGVVKPVVTIDFPITARATRVRASLGAAFRDADRDWYLGISAIQLFRGVSQEAVGADFHGVVHFGRRDVLANPECEDDAILDDCRSKSEFFFPLGVGMMATFDAGPLFSALGSIFQ